MSDIAPLDNLVSDNYAPTSDEKNLALLSHILTFFAGFIGPLVIMLVKKDESSYVRDHAVESLNFQISLFIYIMCCIPLIFVLVGIPLLIVIGISAFILTIVATVKAAEGKEYRYPFTLRLIK